MKYETYMKAKSVFEKENIASAFSAKMSSDGKEELLFKGRYNFIFKDRAEKRNDSASISSLFPFQIGKLLNIAHEIGCDIIFDSYDLTLL